jgi:SAM-dependent methyltransferase
METKKAHARRVKENWFEKYAPEHLGGIDIGCKNDPLYKTFRKWDFIFGDSDAAFMKNVNDNEFQTVYASHILEHLKDPITAIRNWFRITKMGGNLIILVPHRDLYEKRKMLPSRFNKDHKCFWLPEKSELPCTKSFKHTIIKAIPNANIISFKVLNDNWVPLHSHVHSIGEYSIEAIINKNKLISYL